MKGLRQELTLMFKVIDAARKALSRSVFFGDRLDRKIVSMFSIRKKGEAYPAHRVPPL